MGRYQSLKRLVAPLACLLAGLPPDQRLQPTGPTPPLGGTEDLPRHTPFDYRSR